MASGSGSRDCLIDRNPLLRFHSGRRDIDAGREDSITTWKAHGTTLERLLEVHREEKPGVGDYSWEDRTGTLWTFPGPHVAEARKYFGAIERRLRDFQVDDITRLLSSTHTFAANYRDRFRHTFYWSGVSEDEAIAMLKVEPLLLRKRRQLMFSHFFTWIDRALTLLHRHRDAPDGKILTGFNFRYGSMDGQPLFGLEELKEYSHLTVGEMRDFLVGAVLFGHADRSESRERARKAYPVRLDGNTPFDIGYGAVLPFTHRRKPDDMRLSTLDRLAERAYLVEDPRGRDPGDIVPRYVQLRKGDGFSDIGGLANLALQYPLMTLLGGDVMDSADMHEKYIEVPFYGSLPSYLTHYIEHNYRQVMDEDLVDENAVSRFIFLGAKSNHRPLRTSKSHPCLHRSSRQAVSPVESLIAGHPERATVTIDGQQTPVSSIVDIARQRLDDLPKVYPRAA